MNVPLDDLDALIVFNVVMDALAAVTLHVNPNDLPPDLYRGAILLADETLRLVWPLIDQDQIGEPARTFRQAIAQTAASVRRSHHLSSTP